MKKINLNQNPVLDNNITELKKLFPNVVKEGKICFDTLKNQLGGVLEKEDEKYGFTWNGKSKANINSVVGSKMTLLPKKNESKNWSETENLFLEGDNLEILKLLQKSYMSKIKMIYIDPPYNTGNDFVYKDIFKEGVKS